MSRRLARRLLSRDIAPPYRTNGVGGSQAPTEANAVRMTKANQSCADCVQRKQRPWSIVVAQDSGLFKKLFKIQHF